MHTRGKDQRGSALVEFALVSTVLIPLFFGTVALGINVGRMIQAVQLSRDIGHMYAKGVDFSQASNQTIAAALANSTTLTSTGNAVAILSQVQWIYQSDCNAGNHPNDCTNVNQPVIVNRLVLGNPNLSNGASRFGTPPASIVTSSGNISSNDYLTNSGDVATGFSTVLSAAGITLAQGEVTYLAEVYISTPEVSFLPTAGSQGIYARSIF